MQVAILILNYNGKEDTLECLKSLQKITVSSEIIVVDNHSHDGSVKAIRAAFPHVTLIESKENLGFAGGNNLGFSYIFQTQAEYIFLLNNDTTVDLKLLEEFIKAAKKNPKAGIFGAKIVNYSHPEIVDHCGGFWNQNRAEFFSSHKGKLSKDITKPEIVDYVCGCALFMKREVLEALKGFEPKFFLLWEESDFCSRAKKEGFQVHTVPTAIVYHKISASFTGGKPHMHYFWWRNRLLWVYRNLTKREKQQIYRKILTSEICKVFRHFLLRWIQKTLFSTFQSPNHRKINHEKLMRYKAGVLGILHYFFHRFGNCPKSLRGKKQTML